MVDVKLADIPAAESGRPWQTFNFVLDVLADLAEHC
jgi:hypothetical protein